MIKFSGLKSLTLLLVTVLTCCNLILNSSLIWCEDSKDLSIIDKIDSLQKQLSLNPQQVDIRLELAQIYLNIENYRAGSIEYQHIIKTESVSPHNLKTLIQAYYGLGLSYAGLEKYDDAIAAYQKALQYDPDYAHIHAAIGAALSQLHRYNEALKAYKTASDILPEDAMILHQIGNIYGKLGNTSIALKYHEKAVSYLPTFAEAYYQLGLLYAQDNRYNESINAYERAYLEDPELIQSLYNLSQVHLRNGNRDAAREKMRLFQERKAIIEPLNRLRGAFQRTNSLVEKAKIQANIARYYLNANDYQQAVLEYEKSIGYDSKVVEAYNGIGIAYTMLNRFAEAIQSQQKALSINPEFANAHASLGLTYLMQQKHEMALTHYRQAISLSVKNPEKRNLPVETESYKKIGLIQMSRQSYSDAISAFQASLAINPNDAELYHNIGISYANEEKYSDALLSLNKAVEIGKRNQDLDASDTNSMKFQNTLLPETYFMIGELNEMLNDITKAKSAYLNAGSAKSYNALAQLTTHTAEKYKQKNQRNIELQKAISYANTAIALDSSIASYYNTHAIISYKIGDWDTAEESIRKALKIEPENPIYQEGLKQILKR
ncbi:hypothetical protein C6497_16650 [Candidatus Poribacteria bacterium]|nr:MAG: hypothetical protein C6497_16650 [Candidatus Poribacteria bacterium]